MKRFAPILILTIICWLVFLADHFILNGHLVQHGIVPRRLSSLPGILWAPFLHASFQHLAANTLPLLILGAIICGRGIVEFLVVFVAGTLLAGGLTWLIARNGAHVGASGLIFCFFGYLASLAYFRRTLGALALSIVCVVGYGGILKGILPTSSAISWEGHAAGLVAGVILAGLLSQFRKEVEDKPTDSTTL
jgi:membrane associated rhomboid family serine protease